MWFCGGLWNWRPWIGGVEKTRGIARSKRWWLWTCCGGRGRVGGLGSGIRCRWACLAKREREREHVDAEAGTGEALVGFSC